MKVDDKGRCCGRKPIQYRRGMLDHPYQFCPRCDRSFDTDGNQMQNWAWKEWLPGIFLSTKKGSVQAQ